MNRKVKVIGKVQGVFFRKSTQEKANELGIRGWIRNEQDGSVCGEIEGTPEAIDQMEAWLKVGPERAVVQTFLSEEGDEKGYLDFEIKR